MADVYTVVATDDFSTANDPLTTSSNWGQCGATTDSGQALAGMLQDGSGNNTDKTSYWVSDSFADDQYAQIKLVDSNDGNFPRLGVVLRGGSGNEAILLRYLPKTGVEDFECYYWNSGGTRIQLGGAVAASQALADGDTMRGVLIGTTLSVYADFGSGFVLEATFDTTVSAITSGSAGCYIVGSSLLNCRADDWEAGDVITGFSAAEPIGSPPTIISIPWTRQPPKVTKIANTSLTKRLDVACNPGAGFINLARPGDPVSGTNVDLVQGLEGQAWRCNTATSQTAPSDSNSYIKTHTAPLIQDEGITVFLMRRNLDAISRNATGWGNTPTGTTRVQAHMPWSDDTVEWDYGGILNNGRLSWTTGYSKSTIVREDWLFYHGLRGRGIWFNGEEKSSDTLTQVPIDLATTGNWYINRSHVNGDNVDIYLFLLWNRALEEHEIASVYENPWQVFEPKKVLMPVADAERKIIHKKTPWTKQPPTPVHKFDQQNYFGKHCLWSTIPGWYDFGNQEGSWRSVGQVFQYDVQLTAAGTGSLDLITNAHAGNVGNVRSALFTPESRFIFCRPRNTTSPVGIQFPNKGSLTIVGICVPETALLSSDPRLYAQEQGGTSPDHDLMIGMTAAGLSRSRIRINGTTYSLTSGSVQIGALNLIAGHVFQNGTNDFRTATSVIREDGTRSRAISPTTETTGYDPREGGTQNYGFGGNVTDSGDNPFGGELIGVWAFDEDMDLDRLQEFFKNPWQVFEPQVIHAPVGELKHEFVPTKRVRTKQPPFGTKIDRLNPISRGVTLAWLPEGNLSTTRVSSFTDQVGAIPSDFGFIQTDSFSNAINDGGSAVSATEGSLLYMGRVDRNDNPSSFDTGLIGNRSTVTTNWSCQLLAKDDAGGNNNSIGMFSYNGTAETTTYTADDFIPVGGANMTLIGTAKHGDDVRLWAKKPGELSVTNLGSCNMAAATDNISINTYYDLSLERTVNGRVENGGFALTCVWDRQLSETEVLSLLDNPWQLFEPETIHVPVDTEEKGLIKFDLPRHR